MKTYFNSDELPHKWAHQLAERGTCAQSMSFDGKSIFSYAMEIGRIIEHKGKRAYLLNPYGVSSVTTSKHQNAVVRAIPQNAVKFDCACLGRNSDTNPSTIFDYQIIRAEKALTASKTARQRKEALLAEYSEWITKANQVAEFFGLSRRADTSSVEKLQNRVAAQKRKAEWESKIQNAKTERENAQLIEQWINGMDVHFPLAVQKVMLRIELPDGWVISPDTNCAGEYVGEVVTTRGVRIPANEAFKAYRFAMAKRTTGWRRNGETFSVGDFQLDAVNEQGIVAGCHRIEWNEIERFAKSMAWI